MSPGLARSHRMAAELAAVSFGKQSQISPDVVIPALRLARQFARIGRRREAARLEGAVKQSKSAFKRSLPALLSTYISRRQRETLKRMIRLARSFFTEESFFEIAHAIHVLEADASAVEASFSESRLRASKQRDVLDELVSYNALCQGEKPEGNIGSSSTTPLSLLPWAMLSPRAEFFSNYESWIGRSGCGDPAIAAIVSRLGKTSLLGTEALRPILCKIASNIADAGARLEVLHSIGIHDDNTLTALSFAAVSEPLRLRHLRRLKKAGQYSRILDLTEGRIDTCPVDEMIAAARALAECGRAEDALLPLRRRIGELTGHRDGWRVAILAANRASAWVDMIAFCKGAVRSAKSSDDEIFAFRHAAAALRKLRLIARVERLGLHITWRYTRGRLDLLSYINLLRAINRRSEIPNLEGSINAIDDQATRTAFVESLIELSMVSKAMDLIERWKIPRAAISEANRPPIDHFRIRKKTFGVSTGEELLGPLISRVANQSLATQRAPGSASKRRILILASSLGVGGAERQLTHLLTHLDAQFNTCSVMVIVANRKKELDFGGSGHLSILYRDELPRIRDEDLEGVVPHYVIEDIEIGLRRPHFRSLLKRALEFQPDTVYNSIGLPTDAILLGMLTGATRTIVRFGGLSFDNSYNASDEQRIQNKLAERLCRLNAPRLTFISNSFAGRQVWAQKLEAETDKLDVIYNGTRFSALESEAVYQEKKKQLFGESNVVVLGFVGRFHDVKRPVLWVDTAIELAGKYPDLRFLLVGDGPLRSVAEARIPIALRRSFAFTGNVSAELGLLYQSMDLLVMTSRTESFPNVVAEALGYGAFVVSGPVGDVPQLLDFEGAGRIVGSNAFAEFITEIEDVLADLPKVRSTKAKRIEYARARFDMAAMLRNYDAALWHEAGKTREQPSQVFDRVRRLANWLGRAARMKVP